MTASLLLVPPSNNVYFEYKIHNNVQRTDFKGKKENILEENLAINHQGNYQFFLQVCVEIIKMTSLLPPSVFSFITKYSI